MKRIVLKAVDLGVSAVFLTFCTKVFCVHFYKDFEKRRNRLS
jgi:hypothetical protein